MATYELKLSEREDNAFTTWFRGLSQEDQDELRGEVIEPAGFVSPHDWFMHLPKAEQQVFDYTIDWDSLCAEHDCYDCPSREECLNA
jgi:hypothetical protein